MVISDTRLLTYMFKIDVSNVGTFNNSGTSMYYNNVPLIMYIILNPAHSGGPYVKVMFFLLKFDFLI